MCAVPPPAAVAVDAWGDLNPATNNVSGWSDEEQPAGGDGNGYSGRRDGDGGGGRRDGDDDGKRHGGYRGRRDGDGDGDGGGYRGRRDGEGGGFRGRRDEDGGGGGRSGGEFIVKYF